MQVSLHLASTKTDFARQTGKFMKIEPEEKATRDR
jgi:hypothetical protein